MDTIAKPKVLKNSATLYRKSLSILLPLLLILPGCAWIQTDSPGVTAHGQGMVYYLPTVPVNATFIRDKALTIEKATSNLTAAKSATAAASLALKKATAEKKQLDLQITNLVSAGIKPTEKAYVALLVTRSEKAVAVASESAVVASAKKAQQAAETALTLADNADSNQCFEQISIKTQRPQADTSQRFALNSKHVLSRTETARLTTTKSGLLTNIDAKATDDSATILIELARSAGAILGAKSFPMLTSDARSTCKRVSITHVLDPKSSNEWNNFTDAISKNSGPDYSITPDLGSIAAPDQTRPRKASNGIAYRRELPLTLRICDESCTIIGNILEVMSIEVPNHSPTEFLPVAVGTFGSTELDVKLENGILVESNQTRSSELAEAAKVPFKAIEAFGEGIAKVFQLRIDMTTKEVSQSEQDLQLLEAKNALDEREQEIQDLQDDN